MISYDITLVFSSQIFNTRGDIDIEKSKSRSYHQRVNIAASNSESKSNYKSKSQNPPGKLSFKTSNGEFQRWQKSTRPGADPRMVRIPRGGELNFELGTDVRPEVSTTTL